MTGHGHSSSAKGKLTNTSLGSLESYQRARMRDYRLIYFKVKSLLLLLLNLLPEITQTKFVRKVYLPGSIPFKTRCTSSAIHNTTRVTECFIFDDDNDAG